MTDFEKRVLRDYKIDVREIDLFKLYQLSSDSVSSEELEIALSRCRNKWQSALNSPNERVVAPAKKHLENIQQYEAILRNGKLRRELYQYYSGKGNAEADIRHAQQFFALISQTKRVTQKDADFYFDYFPEERKKKKAIRDMLQKSYKLRVDKAEDDEENDAPRKDTKKKPSALMVNLFRRETLLSIRKCAQFLQDASQKEQVTSKYPEVLQKTSLYDYLKIAQIKSVEQFAGVVLEGRALFYEERTEFGTDYVPLVDLYNTLEELLKEPDVTNNFPEFKLLLRYPQLSPYMFTFEEMKPDTLKGFYSLADSIYDFGSFDLFITEYFAPIYDNFGIYDRAIRGILQQAEKRAQSEKLKRTAFEKFCAFVNMPSGIRPKHMAAYWPVFVVYVVFELIKNLVLNIRKVSIVGGTVYGIFYLIYEIANTGLIANWKSGHGLIYAILWICTNLGAYAFSLGLIAAFVWLMWKYAAAIHKTIDWIGMERTFHRLLTKCRDSMKSETSSGSK